PLDPVLGHLEDRLALELLIAEVHVVIDHIDPPADVGSQCLRQRPGVVEAYDDVVAVDEVAHPLAAQGGCRTDQRDSLPFYKLFNFPNGLPSLQTGIGGSRRSRALTPAVIVVLKLLTGMGEKSRFETLLSRYQRKSGKNQNFSRVARRVKGAAGKGMQEKGGARSSASCSVCGACVFLSGSCAAAGDAR